MTRASIAPGCLDADAIARFVDGSLDGARLEATEMHLATCDACVHLVAEVAAAVHPGDSSDSPEPKPLVRGAAVGRYVVVESIGAGAMGRVYAAHDPSLDRRVALKLLHPRAATPDLEARLLREAKAMARLTHPDIITVYDAGRHGNQLFIAMELVEGGTLREWVAREPRSWREILAVFVRAGRGLAAAHAAGIVHRDFKPDNVLVGTDGRVRVTDFGLARSIDEVVVASSRGASARKIPVDAGLTRTGALVGTPVYMAPEQHEGTPAGARSDIYGFCVALYEALYGERPFAATTLTGLYEEKLAGAVRAPAADRNVPPRLRRALLGGLTPRVEDRYESMDALLLALERAARATWTPVRVAGVSTVVVAMIVAAIGLGARHRSAMDASATRTAVVGCTSNAACSKEHHGEPFVCRAADHACVALASPDCTPSFEPEDLATDDTLWLGAMLPPRVRARRISEP